MGKIPLSAKGITDVTTYNHPIDICIVCRFGIGEERGVKNCQFYLVKRQQRGRGQKVPIVR